MSIEKEVTIKLKVPRSDRDGKAFADLSKSAKELDKDFKGAGKAVADMLKEMHHIDRVTKALRDMGVEANAAREAAARMLRDIGDGARITQREIDKLAVGMRALGQGAPAEKARPGFFARQIGNPLRSGFRGMMSDLSGKTGLVALPMMIMGAASQGLSIARQSTNAEDGLTGRRFFEGMVRRSFDIPIFGEFFRLTNEGQALEERDRRLAHARSLLQTTQERMGLRSQFLPAREALEDERRRMQLFSRLEPAAMQQTFAASQRNIAASEAAQDAARMAGRDPREVAARFASAGALESLRIEQGKQNQYLDSERQAKADRLVQKEKELAQWTQAVAVAERGIWQGETIAEERTERRLALQRAIVEKKQRENEVQAAQNALLDVNRQRLSAIVEQAKQRESLLQQERARLTGEIASGRDQVRGTRLAFGRLNPAQQELAIRLGERINRGGRLAREQLEFLSGIPGTERLVNQELERRAAGNFGRFNEVFGVDRELRGREQERVKIENEIKVQLELNDQAVKDLFNNEVLPQVLKAIHGLESIFRTGLSSLANERRIQDGVNTGR